MTTENQDQPSGALEAAFLAKAGSNKSGMTPVGNIAISPTQTNELLLNMQQMIDQRAGVPGDQLVFSGGPRYNTIMGSLKDVAAWASGGVKGPTEGLALRDAEKAKEAKDLFDMRTQMATYKAAQEQAKQDALDYAAKMSGGAGGGAGGTGMTYAGIPVPDSVQARLGRNATQNKAILEEWLKTRQTEFTKAEANPASLARQPVVVWNPLKNEPEVRDVNMFEYQDLKAKGLIKQPSEYYESKASAAPSTETPTTATTKTTSEVDDVLPRIKKAVFSTESTSGKADTSQPGVQGAIGPMQITSDTFDTAKRLKLIPANYDINNKEQNREAGDKLLEYYYNKYDKNPDKTFAAYIGGEGAINKDGTINLERKDALGTSIGQYIAMNKAKAGLAGDLANRTPGVLVASTGKGFPDVAAIQAERKVAEEKAKAAAQETAKTAEQDRKDFKINTNPDTLIETDALAKRVQTLVKQFPEISGVINKNDYTSAVAGVLKEGIGPVTVKGIEDALFKTSPTTNKETLAARNELATYLARMELQAAKLIKGQGQITEGEREILKRASASLDDPAELLYKKARIIERANRKNEELAAVYGAGEKFADFEKFSQDPEFKRIMKEYKTDLNNIMGEKVDFRKLKPGVEATKTTHPADIQDIINKNKPKAQ